MQGWHLAGGLICFFVGLSMLCIAWAGLPMTVDTRGFNQEHVGKRIQVELADGESLEIRLHELTVCASPEPCCGITYILHSTNRSDGKRQNGTAYWTAFGEIVKLQVLGD
ncbi:MAG TPA: hypothetical protein VK850_01460 [Candidatus Binatia bacterium]|nr:hypothetical protein [Candidatus Binatia bacterium]